MSPGSTRENGGRRRAQKISRNAIIVSHTQLHLFSHSLNYNPRTLITHSSLLILGTASSEVRLLYHAISRTRNSKRQNRPSFAYTRTYVAAFWEFTRVYAVYVFVYRYIMYIDSRPFSMFDPFLDIYTCVCVCVCACVTRVYVYVCVYICYVFLRMYVYIRVLCLPLQVWVYACGQMCSMYTTFRNKLLARSSIFFSRAFFFSCVFSRVIASRLEKLNIPCIHIYACLYICVCIQLKGTRCWFLFFLCAKSAYTFSLLFFLPFLSLAGTHALRRRVSYANIISDIIVCMYNRLGYVLRIIQAWWERSRSTKRGEIKITTWFQKRGAILELRLTSTRFFFPFFFN